MKIKMTDVAVMMKTANINSFGIVHIQKEMGLQDYVANIMKVK